MFELIVYYYNQLTTQVTIWLWPNANANANASKAKYMFEPLLTPAD